MLSCFAFAFMYLLGGWVLNFLSVESDGVRDVQFFIIVLISIVYSVLLFAEYQQKYGIILIGAFLLRFLSWYLDLYTEFPHPFSGDDTERFWHGATVMCQGGWDSSVPGGIYSQLLGMFMNISYPEREYMQFSNVLLSSFVPIVVLRSLNLFEIDEKYKKAALILISFAPVSWLLGGVLLREAWIQLFVALGIFFFLRYCTHDKTSFIVCSIAFCLLASLLHAGIIVVVAVIVLYMLRGRSKMMILIIFMLLALVLYCYPDIFLRKFAAVEDPNEYFATINYDNGAIGSRYLSNIEINSGWGVLFYGPLKLIYFMFSPFVWDISNVSLLFLFIGDSLLYFAGFAVLFYHRAVWWKNLRLRFLVFICGLTFFVFGLGTVATGTATRHRNKLFPTMIIVSTVTAAYGIMQKKTTNAGRT